MGGGYERDGRVFVAERHENEWTQGQFQSKSAGYSHFVGSSIPILGAVLFPFCGQFYFHSGLMAKVSQFFSHEKLDFESY